MSLTEISQAETEQQYLKHNAMLMLMIGITFLLDASYRLFFGGRLGDWFVVLFGLLAMLVLAVGVVSMAKSLRYSRRAMFWTNRFNDEWLAHLNMKGYRYAGHSLMALLFITFLLNRFGGIDQWLASLDLASFSTLLLSVGAIAYSLPVLLGLRGADE